MRQNDNENEKNDDKKGKKKEFRLRMPPRSDQCFLEGIQNGGSNVENACNWQNIWLTQRARIKLVAGINLPEYIWGFCLFPISCIFVITFSPWKAHCSN